MSIPRRRRLQGGGAPAGSRSLIWRTATSTARVGRNLHGVGLNFEFAPDLDVQLVKGLDQPTRTFGSTSGPLTSLGGAYLFGMQNNGVLACPKPFPGLGAVTSDAHAPLGPPLVTRTRTHMQVEAVELVPYRAMIAAGQVHAIMPTGLLRPAIDPELSAAHSPAVITGVLRKELGFDGVVVTDALYMGGITDRFSMSEAGVLAILAGNDMLEGAWTASQMRGMIDALRAAVHSGRMTKARIDESVRRILTLKLSYGLIRPFSFHNMLTSAPIVPAPPASGVFHSLAAAPLVGTPTAGRILHAAATAGEYDRKAGGQLEGRGHSRVG